MTFSDEDTFIAWKAPHYLLFKAFESFKSIAKKTHIDRQ
jgi:hypothetical protein